MIETGVKCTRECVALKDTSEVRKRERERGRDIHTTTQTGGGADVVIVVVVAAVVSIAPSLTKSYQE